MNMRVARNMVLTLGASTLAMLFPVGCSQSDDPNTRELDNYFEAHPYLEDPRSSARIVYVTPESVTLGAVGGRAVFKVSGGTAPYRWDVSRTSIGTVSASGAEGMEAVYTAVNVGANDVIVYDQNGHAAITGIKGSPPAAPTISATPTTLSANGALAVLQVSGGTAPYTWTVTDPARGNYPSGNTGTTVVYMRNSAGDNAVTVTDATGNSASVVITQP